MPGVKADASSVDVLVVGAGPTGLTLAGELLRFGLSVRPWHCWKLVQFGACKLSAWQCGLLQGMHKIMSPAFSLLLSHVL